MSVFGDNTGELDPNQVIQQEATNVPAPVHDVHNKVGIEDLRKTGLGCAWRKPGRV